MKENLQRLYDAQFTYEQFDELRSDLRAVMNLEESEVATLSEEMGLPFGVVRGLVVGARLAHRTLERLEREKQAPSLANIMALLEEADEARVPSNGAGPWFLLHKLQGGAMLLFRRAISKYRFE